ncbi:cysteine-rich venom protein-like isoform X1 [Ranitomeya variabilis]|uniref:cysteine-rich venom protein-like isoform X1 n=1 Tax=Ranitomeya variabilis TaxID=490064 RepID=UPI004057C522
MEQRLANLLMLILLQGEISSVFSIPDNENSAVISNSEDIDEGLPVLSHPNKAYLPPCDDNGNVRRRKSLRKRSLGRAVNIPAEAVESVANTPISALSCQVPAIQKEILDVHNKYRSQAAPGARNMLKMVWNSEAAKTAGDWARQCKVGHSPQNSRAITNFKCGENVFLSNFKAPWYAVIDSWYSEYVDYKYGFGALSDLETGHYTQVMWATSYLMGCEVNECSTGPNKYVYVCHVCPAGNKGSTLYPWKEGKPCEDCPNSCENNLCTNACGYQDFFNNCADFKNNCVTDKSLIGSCPATCQCTKGEIK